MSDHDGLRAIYRRFRLGGELRPLVCLASSLALLLLLGGLGLLGGYVFGLLRDTGGGGSPIIGQVRDDDLGWGVAIGGAAWLVLQFWVWRPVIRIDRAGARRDEPGAWSTPLLATALIGAGVTVAAFVVGRRPWDDVEWALTAIYVIGGGAALVVWLPTIFRLERGRPLRTAAGEVDVRCPQCRYSMIGLRTASCPECGLEMTIDELIDAQGYASAATVASADADSETDGDESEVAERVQSPP